MIEHFANLKKKNKEFQWSFRHEIFFKKLKKAFRNNPVIKVFDPTKELTPTTDASERAITAMVSQEGHSRKLTAAETNYSNTEKEALIIVWSSEKVCNL